MQVSIDSTQPDGPYTIELEFNFANFPNTFGTTSHITTIGVAETILYENMAAGMYTLRAYDANGCMGWAGFLMN